MHTIRIFFSKTGESAYISHLDLQRVMARALRRSGVPVWYSQGFNPHIYMSFALPLPLGQESLCESVDCKTESENPDLSPCLPALNAALPRGITASTIAAPQFAAGDIATAEYLIFFEAPTETLQSVAAAYNKLTQAEVLRKTKRTESLYDLKQTVPTLALNESDGCFSVLLPAGPVLNVNPALLCEFLCLHWPQLPYPGRILRNRVLLANGKAFC